VVGRYYNGESAAVEEVALHVTGHELVLQRPTDSSVVARWPVSEIAVLGDSRHEAAPPIVLRGGEARLVVEDPSSRAQLAALMPALAPLSLPPLGVGPRLAGFSLALVTLVGMFWGAVEYGTEYAAPLVPYSLQAKLGESVLDELLADKEECTGKAGLAAITRLANELAKEAGYGHEVKVHIVEGGPVNAFTLPGSILVFYSDLIERAKDSSQVAGVVAHEIGHVVHEHPTKGLLKAYGIDLLLKLLSGGYSDILNTLGSGGNVLLALRNGRAFEREADATGVRLLEQRGLRADGVASFFEQMLEKEPNDAATAAGIWSSHPPTAERIAATRRSTAGRPAFSSTEWQALRNVCR
jgi:Zn-dependent protease with chaperone function